MALETGTFISDLVATNPVVSDAVADGDDHLRLIKSILKGTFPTLGVFYAPLINDFRLTGTSLTPISTVASITTIYMTPYKGNRIALYDGTRWNIRASAEISIALGTLTASIGYDIFCYDNAGTPTLELLAWTDGVTRATALVMQDGILCKSGALTRRYVGSFYTSSTTTTENSNRQRFLYNHANQVPQKINFIEATASWAYTTAVVRQVRATATNQVEFFNGYDAFIDLTGFARASNSSAGVSLGSGIGVNNTTTINASLVRTDGVTQVANDAIELISNLAISASAGYSYYALLESSAATGTTTWESGGNYCGLFGRVLA